MQNNKKIIVIVEDINNHHTCDPTWAMSMCPERRAMAEKGHTAVMFDHTEECSITIKEMTMNTYHAELDPNAQRYIDGSGHVVYDITSEVEKEREVSMRKTWAPVDQWYTTIEPVMGEDNTILGYMPTAEAHPYIECSRQGEEMDAETAHLYTTSMDEINALRTHKDKIKRKDGPFKAEELSEVNKALSVLYTTTKGIRARYNVHEIDMDKDDMDYAQDIKVFYMDHINTPTHEQPNLVDTLECMADEHVAQMHMEELIMDGVCGGKDTDFWQYKHYQAARTRVWGIIKRGKAITKEINEIKAKLVSYKDKKREEWRTGDRAKVEKLVNTQIKKTNNKIQKLEVEQKELRVAFKYLAPKCGWSTDRKAWGRMMFINKNIVGMPEVWYRNATPKQLLTWANMKQDKRMELKRKHFCRA